MPKILMDNFKLDVVADNRDALRLALSLVLMSQRAITFWAETAPRMEAMGQSEAMPPHTRRLVLFWCRPDPQPELHIKPMHRGADVDAVTEMVWDWLGAQHQALIEAGVTSLDDEDVREKLGFRVWNDDWGHVKHTGKASSWSWWQGAAQVEFCYAWVGK